VSTAQAAWRRRRALVSIDHRYAQFGHCRCTTATLLLIRYCQWVWQLRPHWHSWHAAPWSQFGQANQARRLLSASGSIGSMVHCPVRQHPRRLVRCIT